MARLGLAVCAASFHLFLLLASISSLRRAPTEADTANHARRTAYHFQPAKNWQNGIISSPRVVLVINRFDPVPDLAKLIAFPVWSGPNCCWFGWIGFMMADDDADRADPNGTISSCSSFFLSFLWLLEALHNCSLIELQKLCPFLVPLYASISRA